MKSKRGYIIITDELMWEFDIMKTLYSVFFPFHIEYEHWLNRFKIYGVCDGFDELKEGEAPKQYDFNMVRDDQGNISITKINKCQ